MNFLKFIMFICLSPILFLLPNKVKARGMKEYDMDGNKIPVVDRCPITYENGFIQIQSFRH